VHLNKGYQLSNKNNLFKLKKEEGKKKASKGYTCVSFRSFSVGEPHFVILYRLETTFSFQKNG
jgi:hypothetical protein